MDLTSYLIGLLTLPGLILFFGLVYLANELYLERRERRLRRLREIAADLSGP